MLTGCARTIHQAVQNNNLGQVKQMIEADPSLLNAQEGADTGKDGATLWTPLHYAASRKNTKIAKYLLDEGADPWMKGSAGWTALDEAKKVGAMKIEALIEEARAENPK